MSLGESSAPAPTQEEIRAVFRMAESPGLFGSPAQFIERVRRTYPSFPADVAEAAFNAGGSRPARPCGVAMIRPQTPPPSPEPEVDMRWFVDDLVYDPMGPPAEDVEEESIYVSSESGNDDPNDPDYVPSDSDDSSLPPGQRSPETVPSSDSDA